MKVFSGFMIKTMDLHINVFINYIDKNYHSDIPLDSLFIPNDSIEQIDLELNQHQIHFIGNDDVLILFLDMLSIQNDNHPSNKLKLKLLFKKFISQIQILREKDHLNTNQIIELQQFISNNLTLQHKILDLAKLIGINQQYLKVRFKNTFGITVHDYITNTRLETAKKMIKLDSYSMQEIALKVGYSSISSFSQAFKQKIGISPIQYKISFS